MTERSNDEAKARKVRSRTAVAVIAALLIVSITAMALWAFTTLGIFYAMATATPVAVVVACGIVTMEPVAEIFASIVEAVVAIFAAIAEAIGVVVAGILAALAAVFSIFGG